MTHEPSKWLPRFKLGLEVAILLIKMKRDVASSIACHLYITRVMYSIFLGLFNIKKVFSILVLNLGENKGSHLILPRIVLI